MEPKKNETSNLSDDEAMDELKRGTERAKRAIRGEDPDLRKRVLKKKPKPKGKK